MKYFLTSLLLAITITLSAQYTVSGGIGEKPYEYTDGLGGTGISKIYFLNTFSGASISYTSNAAVVRFSHAAPRSGRAAERGGQQPVALPAVAAGAARGRGDGLRGGDLG